MHYKSFTELFAGVLLIGKKEKPHDWSIAEKMAKEISEEYGL